jgi:nucleoside-triphosphatase THEP1
MKIMAEIVLLTGEIQSGKTNLCLDLHRKAQEAGLQVGGVISPAIFEKGEKVAIDILDLKSGNQKRLAELNAGQKSEIQTQRWSFFQDIVEWGNDKLREAVPCDLLVIDELGPLEFQREEGWVNGFHAVESGAYRVALLVIRPSLIDDAVSRWPSSRTVDLNTERFSSLTGIGLLDIFKLK